MGVFYFGLFGTFFFALIGRIVKKKWGPIAFIFLIFVPIILCAISGLRNGIGDTGTYMHSYSLLDGTLKKFEMSGDWGFNLFQIFLYNISSDPQLLILVTGTINNLLNCYVFYKYRSYLELQIYIYIASGYFTVTMNGIRQSVAAAFIFLATKFLIDGKFKKYLITIVFVSTIHQSALLMIPIYFIVRTEAWSKTTFKIIVFSCIGLAFFSVLFPILMKLLENTNYGYYSEAENMGGSSFIRVIVNVVPVGLAYLKRKELKKKWPESNVFVNMALINVIFVAFGMYNWIFNRFTLYFQLYNFILLPYIVSKCFKGKEKVLVYWGFVLCYFIFFYREQVLGMGMTYPSKYLDFNKIFYTTY